MRHHYSIKVHLNDKRTLAGTAAALPVLLRRGRLVPSNETLIPEVGVVTEGFRLAEELNRVSNPDSNSPI